MNGTSPPLRSTVTEANTYRLSLARISRSDIEVPYCPSTSTLKGDSPPPSSCTLLMRNDLSLRLWTRNLAVGDMTSEKSVSKETVSHENSKRSDGFEEKSVSSTQEPRSTDNIPIYRSAIFFIIVLAIYSLTMRSAFYCTYVTLPEHFRAAGEDDSTNARSMRCADAHRESARHALWGRMISYPDVEPSQGKDRTQDRHG